MSASSDIDILARTIWGEDRGGGQTGMTALAWVIKNRIAHPGWVYRVCKAPHQFDCWKAGDPNHAKLLAATQSDPSFALAVTVATGVLAGTVSDPTHGAVSYYAKSCAGH